ncbi:transcription factor bHLH112-like isoform X2 [Cornus florida]|uniref:transcription factor bHLH112-like isoform X2 n=1 Tax=Cornus florida TaxID=4283 RepID=UPI00289BF9C1|nr:transcription factor bHLH112-like isoform X2 [Cornus florida]
MYTSSYKQSLAMADQFQAGICGENWWNSSKSTYGSSLCSPSINDMGSFGWPSELVDIKARSCDESCSVSGESMIVQGMQKPQQPDSDSTWQMMVTTDCNKGSLGRAESNYHYPVLQEDMNSRLNYKQAEMDCPQIEKEWSPSNLGQDSSIDAFKPMNQLGFSLDESCLNSVTSSGNCTPACQGIATGFSTCSASYSTSKLLQTLFDIEPQPQKSQFDKPSMNIPSLPNYRPNLSSFSPSLPKLSTLLNPSMSKLEPTNHFLFNNNTPLYKSQFLASTFEEKPKCPNLTAKPGCKDDVQFSSSVVKNGSSEPALKRQRFDTPSPLPTFKVRKEKLGDRVTALQQLVSPFGKTDTASVLHEAILYIKFLHDQVLSTPYMKNGPPIQHQQTGDNLKIDSEGPNQELRSLGLCLVPISSTFPVVSETTADFWTPTF